MSRLRRIVDGLRRYFRADIYARLFPYVREYKWIMVVTVFLELSQAGLGLLDPWPLKVLIDNGLSGKPLPSWLGRIALLWLANPRVAIILGAVVAGLVLRLMAGVLDIAIEYVKTRINTGMNLRFAADLFNHLLRLSFKYHDQTTVGDSIYRVNSDTGFVSTMIWSNFRHVLTAVVTFAGMLWIVVRLDWQVALLALGVVPVQYISVGLYGRLFNEKAKRIKIMESKAQSFMQEALSCLRVVKAFGQEEREHGRAVDQRWRAVRARIHLDLQESIFSFALRFLSRIDRSAVLLLCAYHVFQGRLTIGSLLVVMTYVGQLQDPIDAIGGVLTDMQDSLVSAERVFEVLDVEPEIKDRPGAKALERVDGTVVFEDVSFGYDPSRQVVHRISFEARAGEVVALVGPTGAGKTTIASLLMRFYDPDSGRVTIDGEDLRDLSVQTLRDNVALVLQESVLFSGSIRDNIAYGRPGASLEEITEAAGFANAHDFISRLPDGYESPVGERGVRLSGGERQRIAVARAFLKNAPVLVLDEPTSSLDSRTEGVILDVLDRLMAGRTTFIIRYADQILVLENGRIVESGVHDDLLLGKGLYSQLHRIQNGALRDRSFREPVWEKPS
jgi:ABC-type multidrug transport system fused ATPase/permease subunit